MVSPIEIKDVSPDGAPSHLIETVSSRAQARSRTRTETLCALFLMAMIVLIGAYKAIARNVFGYLAAGHRRSRWLPAGRADLPEHVGPPKPMAPSTGSN